MARLRLDIDHETLVRLTEVAVTERRPLVWQAEVLLRRALGLPATTRRDAGRVKRQRAQVVDDAPTGTGNDVRV